MHIAALTIFIAQTVKGDIYNEYLIVLLVTSVDWFTHGGFQPLFGKAEGQSWL